MAQTWWNPFDGDVIPGVNVRNAIDQVVTGQDRDIFPSITNSKRPGQINIPGNYDIGADGIGLPGIGAKTSNRGSANTGSSDPALVSDPYQGGSGPYGGGGGGGTADTSAADLAYLDDQEGLLRNILSSIARTRDSGLTQIGDSYNKEFNRTNERRAAADQKFDTQREDTMRDRSAAVGRVNAGARTLSDSVRRMLGMASGTNSSAFQQVAPGMIARDASNKRSAIFDTSGRNLRDIDTAANETSLDFNNYLADLLEQKKQKESGLREGLLMKEQDINRNMGEIARQREAIRGGGYQAMRAASAPFQANIDARQSELDGLFERFRTPYQTRDIQAKAPVLADYTVDRTAVQANQNQGVSPDSPYQQFLKKKFGEQAV